MHVRRLTRSVLFFISAITAIFVLCNIPVVWAQELRAVDVVPDEEKRSSIREVDGYAYLSENMTLTDLRAEAFATAKRQSLFLKILKPLDREVALAVLRNGRFSA